MKDFDPDPEFMDRESQPAPESALAMNALHGAAGRRARFLAVLEGSVSAADFVQDLIHRVDAELSPAFQR